MSSKFAPMSQPISTDSSQKIQGEQTKTTSVFVLVIACALSAIAGVLGYQYYLSTQPAKLTSENMSIKQQYIPPKPSPTPITLQSGKGEYTISQPKGAGPVVNKITFDPLDVQKNETLRLSATIASDNDVSSVTGILKTDSQAVDLIFTKTKSDASSQIWSTEFKLPDSVLYKYILTVTAVDAKGKTTVSLAPRA